MIKKERTDTDKNLEALLPLTEPVLNILLSLRHGERHGYRLKMEAEERTNGKVRMGPGTLYGSLKKMLAWELIEESDERPDPEVDDERRRYYRMTDFGKKVLTAEMSRMEGYVREGSRKQQFGGAKPVWEGA